MTAVLIITTKLLEGKAPFSQKTHIVALQLACQGEGIPLQRLSRALRSLTEFLAFFPISVIHATPSPLQV